MNDRRSLGVELKTVLYKNLSDINSWFKANLLSLNINKTCLLHFRSNCNIDNTLEINYMNTTITNIPSVKFLGLLVDDTLSWDRHINHIASKLSSASYAINQSINQCSVDTYPAIIKKRLKDVILFLCPFSHFIWHNFLG